MNATPQDVASTAVVPAATAPRGIVVPRPADLVAARCAAYGTCSELVASPYEVDVRAALAARRGSLASLPYAAVLADLADEVAGADEAGLRAGYSGLFEVGSEGPPVPIREDLQTGQLSGTREDIVRFYDYFGYRLADAFAWAPDHLSVELEFVHFLCFREAGQDADALSYALAQLDFTERHLLRWVPGLAAATTTHAGDHLYARVVTGIADFIRSDHAWQQSTIGPVTGA